MGILLKAIGFIFNIKMYLIIGLLGAVGGAAVLFAVKGGLEHQWFKYEAKSAQKQTAKNIASSQKESDAIEAAVAKGQAQAERTRQQLRLHLDAQKEKPYAPQDPVDPRARLDDDTVRMLNDIRAGRATRPASRGDGARTADPAAAGDR